jgi:iron complex transport system substrate-binding protein
MRFFIIAVICFGFSCKSPSNKEQNLNIRSNLAKNKYASGFQIVKQNNITVLEIFNPWQRAKDVSIKYKLVKYDFKKEKNDAFTNYIKVPVKKIVCLSTTHIAFIDALGCTDKIVAISGADLVSNPKIRSKFKTKEIYDVGYEQGLNYELLIRLKPDVVFAYGIGSDVSGYITKLNELGIPVVLVGEYLEAHPLAKAEWIKFFAEFFEKQQFAQIRFDSIVENYNKLKELAANGKVKPLVMSGLPWSGAWFVSGGKSYAAKLVEDAGGEFLWKSIDSHESLPMDLETVFQKSAQTDFWLNTGSAKTLKDILNVDARLSNLKPFKEGKIYNNNARLTETGGNDYWESGVINPDVILKDLIVILHPGLLPGYKPVYYKKLN